MEKAIRLKVRKELDPRGQLAVIKLKGSLISKGYTQIIHISDQDGEFHINAFETGAEKRNDARQHIAAFISAEHIEDAVSLQGD
ncbi:hypothetical protein [Flavobacterium ustbae]|uniref:hypothetical protein n=1 Tax=Flavobacterium ustbae TaxID=2488790 RepID=UPI000F7AB8DB|nr:hypothetical protein [Flavobacterium ustbae]